MRLGEENASPRGAHIHAQNPNTPVHLTVEQWHVQHCMEAHMLHCTVRERVRRPEARGYQTDRTPTKKRCIQGLHMVAQGWRHPGLHCDFASSIRACHSAAIIAFHRLKRTRTGRGRHTNATRKVKRRLIPRNVRVAHAQGGRTVTRSSCAHRLCSSMHKLLNGMRMRSGRSASSRHHQRWVERRRNVQQRRA